MSNSETLPEFNLAHLPPATTDQLADAGLIRVFRLEETLARARPVHYSRRDFYKITLLTEGHNLYHYADKSLEARGPALLFFTPHVPYTWQPLQAHTTGFFCLFRPEFFHHWGQPPLPELPLFQPGQPPTYPLTAEPAREARALFEKMLAEEQSDYYLRYNLLRHYTAELLHIALKLKPVESPYPHPNAPARLAAVFLELLERQFPVEPARRLALRSAADFAGQLAVHVNHLNHCVRETTGKTTTAHIAARVASEARVLLRHYPWNIAEVGYALGFDEPAHFTYFFRKQTGLTPSAFRRL